VEPTCGGYLYRDDDNTAAMPNAEARLQQSGLYIVDYGGGARFLTASVMRCLSEFNRVTVSKLDWE
jgi:hypothetical protein